ncbi:MAG: hypothetical protein Q4P13_06385, partial [Psychrobacter sp.]|nr:hypothetical protein [Psychrobacter sp.]
SAPSSITHQSFNLIVISEILYYLSPDDIDSVIDWIGQHLALDGTLLCCHWRYAIEGFEMTGETVHERLYRAFGPKDSQANSANNKNAHHWALTHQSRLVDSDFLLDVWQNSTKTVAMQENLV